MPRGLYKTDIEEIMDIALQDAGFIPDKDYVYNFPIRGAYILDFAFPKEKINIECDGERWHPKENKYDKKRNYFLKRRGWIVLRFTGRKIKEDIKNCIEIIKGEIYGKRKKDKS